MTASQYWMITRPQRKLIRVPQMVAAFASVAAGQCWTKNKQLQMDFEDKMELLGVKKTTGQKTERDRNKGGSGGRTYAAMLTSLGLIFFHKDDPASDEEVHLTLAGQALVDHEDALPILRKQVIAHQFPSAYSTAPGVNVDRKFKLRPFVLMLRLLTHPHLGGYLRDEEIAACVIGYGTRHTAKEADLVAQRILKYRVSGINSLDDDFAQVMDPAGKKSAQELISTTLDYVANTASKWLQYTGYASAVPGEEFGIDSRRAVLVLNEELRDEVEQVIEDWSKKPLIEMYEPDPKERFKVHRAREAFQRTYGVKVGAVKDSRQISTVRQSSDRDRSMSIISGSLRYLYATQIVTEVTSDIINAVVNHTGMDRQSVEKVLREIISTPQVGLNQFLDRYRQMAFSGTDEAIAFESATASILQDVFKLNAVQIGQGGKVPDVEVWNEKWLGIIDTKAYSSYGLDSDHQLRMQTNYVPRYDAGKNGSPLRFFMYISGGFAPSFNPNLKKIVDATSVHGSGISMNPWLDLILGYPNSSLDHDSLLEMWSMGREITGIDVAQYLARSN